MRRTLLVATLLLAPLPAFAAQGVDEATATKLQTEFRAALTAALDPHFVAKPEDLTVKIDGDALLFTIPEITMSQPSEPERVRLGTITMRMVPEGEANYRLLSLKLAPLTLLDNKDKVLGTLTIGRQNASGFWDAKTSTIDNGQFDFGDFIGADAKGMPVFRIGTVRGSSTTTKRADAKVDARSDFAMDKVEVLLPKGTGSVVLGSLTLSGTGKGMDLAKLTELQSKANELQKAAEGIADPKDITKDNAEKALADLQPFAAAMPSFFSDVFALSEVSQFGLALTNLRITIKDPKRPLTVTLPSLKVGSALVNKPDGMMDVSFSYRHDNLAAQPVPAEVALLLPKTITLSTTTRNVPFAKLMENVAKTGQQYISYATAKAANPKEQPALPKPDMKTDVLATLAAANTTVQIANTGFMSAGLAGKIEGDIKVDPKSAIGAVGQLNATLRGLSELIKRIQAAGPQSPLGGMVSGLAMAQMMGKPATPPATPSSHTYAMEVVADGTFKLNGNPMGNVKSMAPRRASAPRTAAPRAPAPDLPPPAYR